MCTSEIWAVSWGTLRQTVLQLYGNCTLRQNVLQLYDNCTLRQTATVWLSSEDQEH